MSNKKKPKKLRTPNLPAAQAATSAIPMRTAPVEKARGGGAEVYSAPRSLRAEPARVTFDYGYVRKDLTRIGVLAGGLITALVILSFIIR